MITQVRASTNAKSMMPVYVGLFLSAQPRGLEGVGSWPLENSETLGLKHGASP